MMYKNCISIVAFLCLMTISCDNKEKSVGVSVNKEVEDKSSQDIHTDTVVFELYLKDKHLDILIGYHDGERLYYDLKNDLKKEFLKDDLIEVKWMKDLGKKIIVTTSIIADGSVSKFRKSNDLPLLVKWNGTMTKYEWERHYLIQIVEYYLYHSSSKDLSDALKRNADLYLELEKYERNDKNLVLISINENKGSHSQLYEWLMFDLEEQKLFSYDLEMNETHPIDIN